MPKVHRSHKKSLYGKNLVILPIVFCAVIYLVCALILFPSASSYLSRASMFFSDNEKNFSKEYVNIFVPVDDFSDYQKETQTSSSESSSQVSKQETVNISSILFPSYDNQFGELIIEDCQIRTKLFFW